MQQSTEIKELAMALAKAQAKIGHAEKSATNPHFGKTYADLASVLDACRGPLSENGLSVSQVPIQKEIANAVSWILVTRLLHSSGQWIEGYTPILSSKSDAQGFGSGMTYARRYGLSAIVGVAQDDDDGNAAVGPKENNQNNNKNNNQQQNRQQQQQQNQNNPANRETKSANGVIKNQAPISSGDAKKLFDLTAKKNISNDSLKEMLRGFYQIDKTTELKQWQLVELEGKINNYSIDQIAVQIVEVQAQRETPPEG